MSLTVLGVLTFVVVLLVSVAIHEFGHLLTAKRFGMKATEYFIGFGPRLWSFRRGETEYGLKAIPAGGYVKIVGMTDLEEVAPEDQPRAFYRQPAPQRLVVLAAGSVSHLVIGFLIFLFVLTVLGRPVQSTTVAEVSPCVPIAEDAPCSGADPPSPAAAAGLQPGDRIVAVGGTPVRTWTDATQAIRAAGGKTVPLVVERDGRELRLTAGIVKRERQSRTDPARTETVGVLGVTGKIVMARVAPVESLTTSARLVWGTVVLTGQVLVQIPGKIPELFDALSGGQRDPAGLVGVVGIARISGETLSSSDLPFAANFGAVLLQMAALNVFIGLFNALPLLPLDGGHIAVVLFETVRSRLYRVFGRPDPGRVDLTKLLPAAYVFLILLVGLTVLLLAADIVNPVQIPS
jgi:membrane-associated protease RseP (regulator of RpoE activity)